MLEMTGLRVAIDPTPGVAGAATYNSALKSMGTTAATVSGGVKAQLLSMGAATKVYARTVSEQVAIIKSQLIGMKEIMAAGILGFGVAKIVGHVQAIEGIKRALEASTGSAAGAQAAWARLQVEGDKLGMASNKIGAGFARMQMVMNQTASLHGARTWEVFEDLAMGIRAAGKGPDELNSLMEKVTSILSRAKVQDVMMVRGMASEIPAAFQEMAKGMGMSQEQLTTAIEKGKYGSEQLIYAMAQQLRKDYAGIAADAAKGMGAWLQRLEQTSSQLMETFAASGFAENFIKALQELNETLKMPEAKAFIGWLGSVFGSIVKGVSDAIRFFGNNLGTAKTILIGFITYEILTRFWKMGEAIYYIVTATRAWATSLAVVKALQVSTSIGNVATGATAAIGFGAAKASAGFLSGGALTASGATVGVAEGAAGGAGTAAVAGTIAKLGPALLNPWVLIAAAIVAASVAAYHFRDSLITIKGEEFKLKDIWNGWWIGMKENVSGPIAAIKDAWGGLMEWLKSSLSGGPFQQFVQGWKDEWLFIKEGAAHLIPDSVVESMKKAKAQRQAQEDADWFKGSGIGMARSHLLPGEKPDTNGKPPMPKEPKAPITLLLEEAHLKADYAAQMAQAALRGPAAVSSLQGAQQTAIDLGKGKTQGLTGNWTPKMCRDTVTHR